MNIKKNPKANVGRNSSLYFAIGLSIMLTFSYLGLEYKTYNKNNVEIDLLMLEDQLEEDVPITTIEVELPPPPQKPAITEAITIVEDEIDIKETFIESTEIGQNDIIADVVEAKVEEITVEEVEEDIEIPFSVIEKIPVFPGCSGNNDELKACFQQKINKHIQKNFRYPEAAQELNISGKVYVFFLIDKTGRVTKVKSRGPDKILEKEAERIINLLPKMEPGKQRNVPVGVPYSIPINFKIQI